jgi:hypothetical protein
MGRKNSPVGRNSRLDLSYIRSQEKIINSKQKSL